MLFRAGIPEPGSLGSSFLGLEGDGVAFGVGDGVGVGDRDGVGDGFGVGVGRGVSESASVSRLGTGPAWPVFHGIGSTCWCR